MEEKPAWEVYPGLVEMVRQYHKKKNALIEGSHNFLHALMVAQYAWIIAEGRIKVLAWVAGLIHNTDRLFPEQEVLEKLKYYLEATGNQFFEIGGQEKEDIIEAVLNHSKLNDPKDNPVTIVLKDADRLANIGPNMPVRSGQHHYNLPDCNPLYLKEPDPKATYRNPLTCLHDIGCALEWEDWLRTPKAKRLAKKWFKLLKAFVSGFAEQMEEVSLLPYPFPEDYE